MGLQPRDEFFGDHPNASSGVVDATGMAIGEHHAGIDHGGSVGGHHAPAEALHVDQLQQPGIPDVAPCHITHVDG
jgi:hypothetical protein